MHSHINLSRAHYIANNHIDKFSYDKVWGIYNYEIEYMSPASDHYHDLEYIFFRLSIFFLKSKKKIQTNLGLILTYVILLIWKDY